MRAFNSVLLAVFVAVQVVAATGAAAGARQDTEDATIRAVLIEAAEQLGWGDPPPGQEQVDVTDFGDIAPVVTYQRSEWLTGFNDDGTQWFMSEGALTISAYADEAAAEAFLALYTETFHGYPAFLERFEVPQPRATWDTIGWREGRFILEATAHPDTVEAAAEALYASAVEFGLIAPGPDGSEATTTTINEPGFSVTVRVEAPGYQPGGDTFVLDFDPSSIELSGRVVDAEGVGIPGATVTLGGLNAATSADDAGRYRLVIGTGGTQPFQATRDWTLQSNLVFQIVADPPAFRQPNDTVEVTVTVLDSALAPLADELVEIEPQQISAAGTQVLLTDPNGRVRFTTTHLDARLITYEFIVRVRGVEQVVTVPVLGAHVELNQTLTPVEPYLGVAADGVSTLAITLNFPTSEDRVVTVNEPATGTLVQLVGADEEPVGRTVRLDDTGRAELLFTPPAYLPAVDHALDVHTGGAARARGTIVDFTFATIDGDGSPIEDTVSIGVYRPPVLLVHGFIGGLATWNELAAELVSQGYDPSIAEYFVAGDDSDDIYANARRLRANIEAQKVDYADHGIKLQRVDVVGHSMGGLISRAYIELAADFAGDVRKLIMVGTPNHGVGYLDAALGRAAANWFDQHRAASVQLYAGSDFMARLNAGEEAGAHLANGVEYANLVGRMHCYAGTHLECAAGDGYRATDGVVDLGSARLAGVETFTFDGDKHSGDLFVYDLDESITTDPRIWARIEALLQEDIESVPLRSVRIDVTRVVGEVILDPDVAPTPISTIPIELKPWVGLRTGSDGRAIVDLRLDGATFAKVLLAPETELYFGYASPDHVRVYLRRGSALFRSLRREGRGLIFDLPLDLQPDGAAWHEIRPRARITHRETEFVVEMGSDIRVYSLDGTLLVGTYGPDGLTAAKQVGTGTGLVLPGDGSLQPLGQAPQAWWEEAFYVGGRSWLPIALGAAGGIVGVGLIGVALRRSARRAARRREPTLAALHADAVRVRRQVRDRAILPTQVQPLVAVDSGGRYWALYPLTGDWSVWDGSAWVPAGRRPKGMG